MFNFYMYGIKKNSYIRPEIGKTFAFFVVKALGKAKLVDASVPVEKIFREVFQSLSPFVLLVEV